MNDLPFSNFKLIQAPGHLLRRCHQRSHELYNEVTSEFGLTRQQFALMVALLQNPGASVQELADLTGVDRNTLGGIVGRLLDKKLISRRRSSSDARAYEVQIRPVGIELLRAMEDSIAEVQKRIMAPLSPAEERAFILLAQKLIGLDKGAPETEADEEAVPL